MATIDLKKVHRHLYRARPGRPELVDVPPGPHLMVDGEGDPNSAKEYRDAVEALYPMAYGVRAAIKAQTGDAYTVMPLEGLWWVDDMRTFSVADKAAWKWTLLIRLPEVATAEMAADVFSDVLARKRLVAGDRIRFEMFGDGLSAQVLHVGPYADEAPTIAALHEFIDAEGLGLAGRHHEIYLGDPRRADPSTLKTIIRQPVAPA